MVLNQKDKWGYLVVWEFRPRSGRERDFEHAYGPNGDWADCFRQGKGYLGTELGRDRADSRRYLTMDFWESRAAYEAFKAEHAAEYHAIDQRCEALTEHERELGTFERVK